jgi:hypothetical protein
MKVNAFAMAKLAEMVPLKFSCARYPLSHAIIFKHEHLETPISTAAAHARDLKMMAGSALRAM